MTYEGERARAMASERGRCFEVSKVRIGTDGHVSEVLWSEVGGGSNRDVGTRVLASVAEVVDAIHEEAQVAAIFPSSEADRPKHRPERVFVIVEHEDGRECIAFEGPPSPGRDLVDVVALDA